MHDSGLLHALLGLGSLDALLAHPVAGTSPEGFAVETLINAAPRHAQASFYSACEDLQPRERWLVQGGADMQPYPVGDGVQAIGLRALAVRRPSLSESGHSVSTAVWEKTAYRSAARPAPSSDHLHRTRPTLASFSGSTRVDRLTRANNSVWSTV